MEFISANAVIILAILLGISELLANTKLFKENSIFEAIVDLLKWLKERAKE